MVYYDGNIDPVDIYFFKDLIQKISNELDNKDINVINLWKPKIIGIKLIIEDEIYFYNLSFCRLSLSFNKIEQNELTKKFNANHYGQDKFLYDNRTEIIPKNIFIKFIESLEIDDDKPSEIIKEDDTYMVYHNKSYNITYFKKINCVTYNNLDITHLFEKFERKYKIAQLLI